MKSKSIQAKYRKEVFNIHQYWNMNYTEKYFNGLEKDFKTFIKAKSYETAKEILRKRLSEEDPSVKIKAVQGYMFHKNYKNAHNVKLRLKEWDQIRTASFPNENNVLYKMEIPRPEGYTNRFNKTDYEQLKKIGFKKGKENWSHLNRKGKILPLEKRDGMIYRGKWIKWDKNLMKQARQKLIGALVSANGNRTEAAKLIGVSRRKLYDLMAQFPKIDWKKDYPTPKPFSNSIPATRETRSKAQKKSMKRRIAEGYKPFDLSEEDKKKRVEKRVATAKKKRQEYLKSMIPKIKKAFLANNNKRKVSAQLLGISVSCLCKIMRQTQDVVDWKREFPNPNIPNYLL